jgi:hypothetical protein
MLTRPAIAAVTLALLDAAQIVRSGHELGKTLDDLSPRCESVVGAADALVAVGEGCPGGAGAFL